MKDPETSRPYAAAETDAFAVLYKPPRAHCFPDLLEWYAALFPAVMNVRGRREGEGGLLHRLDFETRGVVLAAKTQAAFDALSAQQREGLVVKGYRAVTRKRVTAPPPGFPPPPGPPLTAIASYFRPWGPGRKAVRPVPEISAGLPPRRRKMIAGDQGRPYVTQILSMSDDAAGAVFCVQLRRGFRHQIRCHLAWAGYPIVGDALYGAVAGDGDTFLELCAEKISFIDPVTNVPREYRLNNKDFPLIKNSGKLAVSGNI